MPSSQYNVYLDDELIETIRRRVAACESTHRLWLTRVLEEALEKPIQVRFVTKQVEEKW